LTRQSGTAGSNAVDDVSYTYDDAGEVLSLKTAGTGQTQDRRLTMVKTEDDVLRTIYQSGTVTVVTESSGSIVVTVITR